MKTMSAQEIQEFLMFGTRTGKLATVRADGRPHVAPIWFILDGEDILFNTWHTSVKGKNVQRDGQVALCVDNENPPYDFIIVEGIAAVHSDPDELRYWATKIAARYMGEDQAEAFGIRNSVPGELLVRVKVNKVIAKKDVSG